MNTTVMILSVIGMWTGFTQQSLGLGGASAVCFGLSLAGAFVL